MAQAPPPGLPIHPALGGAWKSASNAGETGLTGSSPRWGRCPGGGNGNPLHSSWLENSVGRGACLQSKGSQSRTRLNTAVATGDSNAQPVINIYVPRPKPASRRFGFGGLGSPPVSCLPFPRRGKVWELAGPGPKNGSKEYPEWPKRLLNGCKRPCGLPVHAPRLRPRRKTRSGRISPERLLGERTHQKLQQGLVEGAGRFLRPLALICGRPRAGRVQTPQGDRGRRRACPSQRWREPAAHSAQHGLPVRDRASARPRPPGQL